MFTDYGDSSTGEVVIVSVLLESDCVFPVRSVTVFTRQSEGIVNVELVERFHIIGRSDWILARRAHVSLGNASVDLAHRDAQQASTGSRQGAARTSADRNSFSESLLSVERQRVARAAFDKPSMLF